MTSSIKEAEARLKEAFGDDKFDQFKNAQNKIIERHKRSQIKMRQEMFSKMNKVTEDHFDNF